MKCLDCLALERDHRAAMVFKKCLVNFYPDKSCLSEYQQLLTSYVFSFLAKQFELCRKVTITESVDVNENSYTTTICVKGRSFLTFDYHCNCRFCFIQLRNCHVSIFLHYVNMLVLSKTVCYTMDP